MVAFPRVPRNPAQPRLLCDSDRVLVVGLRRGTGDLAVVARRIAALVALAVGIAAGAAVYLILVAVIVIAGSS